MKLDSHQHFWRYDECEYPWIPKNSPLERDWLPVDLECEQADVGFDGSVAVQARQTIEESRWLLELADQYPAVKGVVGWVDLRGENVEDQLAELAPHPKFVGVRHVVQDEPDDNFMLQPDFLRGISKLKQFHLTYDILIFPKQLPAAIQMVHQFPEQRFVLDHIAKPFIRDRTLEPWSTEIKELTTAENVWCKISGMITEAKHGTWREEDFRPYLDVVFGAFRPGRLMFGSDWPVCLLSGSYDAVVRLVENYLRGIPSETQRSVWGSNCAEFYGLRV